VKYRIEAHGRVIGHSDLEHSDPGMGVLEGRFYPEAGYAAVREVFRIFGRAMPMTSAETTDEGEVARYYRERDELDLMLIDQEGHSISTSWIHIHDYEPEAGPDAMQVEVSIDDPRFWAAR
jgi:hypothetical protein